MPRTSSTYVPKYRYHKPSGQARVTIGGKDYWLGPWRSKASLLEYDRVINEWLANGRRLPDDDGGQDITIVELIAAYLRFAKTYYSQRTSGTKERSKLADALRPVKELYGRTPAVKFGPKRLKAVRQRMIDSGCTRKYINTQIGRIKRMFRWAVAEELVPPTVYQALAVVDGLKRGRSNAKESAPVLPVSDEVVNATLGHLPEVVADMVRLQRLTGCRPGEICQMRPCDVDRSGDVWTYRPAHHKTEYRGKERVVFIGPRGQAILKKYLLRPEDMYCFSPRESEKRRRFLEHQARKTPISCGNRPGSNVKAKPKRSAGDCYRIDSYRRAIYRACEKAGVEKWTPHRLRHTAATEIRKRFGLEAAQVALGHAQANVTQIYAERDTQKAREVARKIG